MKESLKEFGGLLPADAQPPEVLEPADGAFNSPPPRVAAEDTCILGYVFRLAVAAMRRDHLHALFGHRFIQRVAVIGLVTNDSLRRLLSEHEVEKTLNQCALMRSGRHGIDCHGQAACIDQNHDFYALSHTCAPDSIAAAAGFAEGSVDKTLVEPVLPALFDHPPRITHNGLEHAFADPPLEPTMNGALGAKLGGKILPFGAVVEYPEDTLDDFSLVGRRPASKGASRRVRNPFREPIELRICKS